MYVNNLHNFGHLVRAEPDDTQTTPVHLLEFYDISKNRLDWQKEYIHDDYWKYVSGELKPEQVCTDVYRFRVVTDRFCHDLVNIVENDGLWNDKNDINEETSRHGGDNGHKSLRYIHMTQVKLHDEWLFFVTNYIQSLQKIAFPYNVASVSFFSIS